jgi:hypothetical protein
MNLGLRALLTGLIDYAGLFPPAKLPLSEALGNYLRYRDQPEAWMLGRFVCPASRLGELSALAVEVPADRPLPCSALGRGGDDAASFLAGLDADLADVAALRAPGSRVAIDVLETRLPAGVLADAGATADLLRQVAERTRSLDLALFFEVSPADRDLLARVLGQVRQAGFGKQAGYKLRAGGLEAPAFPSSAVVAGALTACLAEAVPFKATAGLHHPFPRFDAGLGARMHGFVNLFAAGVLAQARYLGAERTREVLDDEDPGHFHYDDAGLRWQTLEASTGAIAHARQHALLSFGSCSFDEPRDDLRALGWL